VLPTVAIINLAFRSNAGKLTLDNIKVIVSVDSTALASRTA